MAGDAGTDNGRGRLEEAITLLIQNQAAFVGRISESERLRLDSERERLEFERQHREFERQTAERFAEIIRVLSEHGQILERLTEAVREKIGFKGTP